MNTIVNYLWLKAVMYYHCFFRDAPTQNTNRESANRFGIEYSWCMHCGGTISRQDGSEWKHCSDTITFQGQLDEVVEEFENEINTLQLPIKSPSEYIGRTIAVQIPDVHDGISPRFKVEVTTVQSVLMQYLPDGKQQRYYITELGTVCGEDLTLLTDVSILQEKGIHNVTKQMRFLYAVHKTTGERKRVNIIHIDQRKFNSPDDKDWGVWYSFAKQGDWELHLSIP